MVNLCGLNRMTAFGTWLAPQIQAAKKNPELLRLLQEMRTVSYGGVPISVADDDWCFQNGIPLMVGLFLFCFAPLLLICSTMVVKGHVCDDGMRYAYNLLRSM